MDDLARFQRAILGVLVFIESSFESSFELLEI